MRRAVKDAIVSAGGLVILLIALLVLDGRVREQAYLLVNGQQASEIVSVGQRLHNLASVATQVARDQGLEHGPLVIFAFAGIVLFGFALRL